MSLKRTYITIRYWLTKRWRILYCCIGLILFTFLLLTSKYENYNTQFINLKPSTVSLRHSLTASGEQQHHQISSLKLLSSLKLSSFKSQPQQQNFSNSSITNRLNDILRNSWSTINKYYNKYYQTKIDNELESNMITLFRSNKFQKFNEINFDFNQQILQLNISDDLSEQLDLIVRRVIEYHENIFNLKQEERLNKDEHLTINLIKQMLAKQNDKRKQLAISYTDHWQPVIGVKEKSRVYSAYYEPRLENGKFIRIIGAARTMNLEPLYCAQWFIENNKLKLLMTQAINRAIRENWNLKYSAYYLLCPLDGQSVPLAVSILKKKSPLKTENDKIMKENDALVFHALGNFILVQNNLKFKKDDNENNKIAICVKPLHYEYNKLDNLIEFIELNKILGVDHFLFYNHTVGSKVNCLLNEYIKKTDSITILPWHNLDMKSQEEIRTEGIFASLNDCLYRTMWRFKYVVMIDLDEYIIPHLDNNLKGLLKRITNFSISKNKAGAFSFRNSFYYLQWPDDPEYLKYSELDKSNLDSKLNSDLKPTTTTNHLPVYLTTLAKTRHRALHSHRERSKLIIIPESVVEVGNHFIWQLLPDKFSFHIDQKVAYLHHYRICEFGGTDCLNSPSFIDYRTKYWSKELIQKSISTFGIYNQTCV